MHLVNYSLTIGLVSEANGLARRLTTYGSNSFILNISLAGNVPLRDYQFLIVKTALFSNTLVSLPTGLGKTLIAAVVMYNYFRWFPAGMIYIRPPLQMIFRSIINFAFVECIFHIYMEFEDKCEFSTFILHLCTLNVI